MGKPLSLREKLLFFLVVFILGKHAVQLFRQFIDMLFYAGEGIAFASMFIAKLNSKFLQRSSSLHIKNSCEIFLLIICEIFHRVKGLSADDHLADWISYRRKFFFIFGHYIANHHFFIVMKVKGVCF